MKNLEVEQIEDGSIVIEDTIANLEAHSAYLEIDANSNEAYEAFEQFRVNPQNYNTLVSIGFNLCYTK